MTRPRLVVTSVFFALMATGLAKLAFPQDRPPELATSEDDPHGWPRTVEDEGVRFTVFEPQLEKWENARLVARSAVSVEVQGESDLALGTVWLTARTEVDKAECVVLLEDLELTRAVFPEAPDKADAWLALLRKHAADLRIADLSRFAAGVAGTRTGAADTGSTLRNDPPRIFFSTGIAVLVLLDGPPALRPVGSDKLQRVINTRALLLQGGVAAHYYLAVCERWLEAPKLEGPWTLTSDVPRGANEVRRELALTNQIELYERDPDVRAVLARNEAPTVLLSTEPAELIETTGDPELVPIDGTRLLRVRNTDADVFLDPASNEYYTLISGRWFRSTSREGPWAFVPGRELPDEFAKIPENDPAGEVLVAVPGTSQAQEALVENEVPETATVQRDAGLTVTYDGEPVFETVDGTNLQYAVNSPTPVLQCGASFYACEQGVWFVAASSLGPWAVADGLPDSIDSLPTSCPIHFVKYARILDARRDAIVVGYTPGYLGTCVSSDNTIVWGTGYSYHGWARKRWIGRATTYGLGVGSHWIPRWGWSVGLGIGSRSPLRPWWSPLVSSVNALSPIATPGGLVFPNLAHANVYTFWKNAVRFPNAPRSTPTRGTSSSTLPGSRPSRGRTSSKTRGLDLYATPEGMVFQRGKSGWETRSGSSWGRPRVEATDSTARLDVDHHAREVGAARSHELRAVSSSSSSAPVRRSR